MFKLGEFEELILLAVAILEDNAYSIPIKREIEMHTGRSLLLGAVHSTLYRLEDKGFLKSKLGGESKKRGDRRKRLFKLTDKGVQAVKDVNAVRTKMWSLISGIS